MKTVRIWIFLGLIGFGLSYGSASLSAQPASGPASTNGQPAPAANATGLDDDDDPDKPWNKGVSLEDRRVARELFREGNRLFKIPLFMKAAEKYAAALTKWKHPGIYLNLAIAQLNSGQEVEAYSNLERALEHDEEPLGKEQFEEAQKQLEEVRLRLGRIRVTCRTQGAQVTLNGVPLFIGPGSYEGWVKAKDHELTAKKPEYLSEARRVTIVPGQSVNIDLKLVTLSEATDASRRWAAWKPWVVVAAGGAVVAAGGVLNALANRSVENFDRRIEPLPCVDPTPEPGIRTGCSMKKVQSNVFQSRVMWQQRVAVGSYIAGSSLVAVGIVLFYMNRPRLEESRATGADARKVLFLPVVSNDMLGISVNVFH